MSSNQAVVIQSPGVAKVVDAPYPTLPGDDYIIVRTTAVALNPTDWKHVDRTGEYAPVGSRVGCDYAGIVEEVGPAVKKPLKKGDRVFGLVYGSHYLLKESGAFAKYITAKGDLAMKTPDHLSDEQVATQGVAIFTVGQNLYQSLGLPLPNASEKDHNRQLLVYGGSTAMGIEGIQFAKLSGVTVIATASPRNFDLVKSLGADHVLDYNSPTLQQDIRKLTGDNLKLAWDCIGTKQSVAVCARALSAEGGRISALLRGLQETVEKINPSITLYTPLAYTALGEPLVYNGIEDPVSEDIEFGKSFAGLAEQLLTEGKIKPPNIFVNRGGSGLEGVLVGLQELKDGKVSAGKLVYTL